MVPEERRKRMRERVGQWRARLEALRAESTEKTAEARRAHVARLEALQATIAQGIREWNASIDDYDMDPARTTQREFDEQRPPGLREIEKQIKAEIALWTSVVHDVG